MHSRKREPTAKKRFVAKFTDLPAPLAVDTTIPAFGQRKRKAKSRAPLRPNPSKAD